MPQTRMFRDRMVSMEQTFEGGEKHLALLKEICGEALPGFVFREHSLDHERDLFVMDFEGEGGTRRRVCWTRMVLFDAERIPTLAADPAAALRSKIVELVRAQAAKPEILVTFRHLEEGWVDTPEPRREGRRRRRRGGRGGERGGARAGAPPRDRDRRPGGRPASGAPPAPQPQRGPAPARAAGAERRPAGSGASPDGAPTPGGGGKRRRRRRRRGRGPGGAGPGPGAPPQGPRP
ncbi:MAG TPA: hypothetical protein VKG23_13780 [Thermoanaerobaculia bacterium]|nr:hypothetical protein [Thermoanaerobaculia bacterium]